MPGFEELYTRYFDDVFRFLRAMTADEHLAEELTEETFFKALKALDSFRGQCDVRVWLCQIAKNAYFSHLRREKRLLPLEDAQSLPFAGDSLENLIADKDLAFRLHQILHDLKEPYKEVFTLRVFGELPFKKIGLLFGKSEHWACVTYHRAKAKIQERMVEHHEDAL